MLREVKNKQVHYFIDDLGRKHGEYTAWHDNGKLKINCWFLAGEYHGEYKRWFEDGQLHEHTIYENNKWFSCEYKAWTTRGTSLAHFFFDNNGYDIYLQVKEVVKDIYNMTDEEKFLIKIKFGIKALPKLDNVY